MIFGSNLSNGPIPVGETYFQTTINTTSGGNEIGWEVGTYSMPFAGHLMVNMWAEVAWPGTSTLVNGLAAWLSPIYSVPACDGYGDMGIYDNCAGIFSFGGQPRCHGIWANLAPGAYISLHARFYNTPPGLQIKYVGGFFQPMAT